MNITKLIQIVNYILSLNDKKINYTKLIKLLYIADKRAIEESGFPITGDQYSSLPQGPVLSKLLDLIKRNRFLSQTDQVIWNTFFVKDEYDLQVVTDNNLNTDELSKREIRILTQVDAEFKKYNAADMIKFVHNEKSFPEVKWRDARKNNTSYALPIDDLYKSVGYSQDDINEIVEEQNLLSKENKLIHQNC